MYNSKIQNLKYWIPSILYMLLIFFISSNPAPESAKAIPLVGPFKIVHIVEYGVLSALYFYALHGAAKLSLINKLIFSVFLTYFYGVFDEIHQSFNPLRSASFADTITNFIGAVGMQGGIWGVRAIFRASSR